MLKKVNFSLNSGYKWGLGMDPYKMKKFEEEIRQLFGKIGWNIEKGDAVTGDTVTKGINNLYIHPMEITGIIEENLIPIVESVLLKGKTFSLTETEIIEDVEDWDDDQYKKYLDTQKESIKETILEYIESPGLNDEMSIIFHTVEKHRKLRICDSSYILSTDAFDYRYVEKCFYELLEDKKIRKNKDKKYLFQLVK